MYQELGAKILILNFKIGYSSVSWLFLVLKVSTMKQWGVAAHGWCTWLWIKRSRFEPWGLFLKGPEKPEQNLKLYDDRVVLFTYS